VLFFVCVFHSTVSKILLGHQPCQLVKIAGVSGTVSVLITRFWWFLTKLTGAIAPGDFIGFSRSWKLQMWHCQRLDCIARDGCMIDERWIIKDLEGSDLDLDMAAELPGGTEPSNKNLNVACVPTEIWTNNLPNPFLELYRHANSLSISSFAQSCSDVKPTARRTWHERYNCMSVIGLVEEHLTGVKYIPVTDRRGP
jgi:hypothetical protein